MTWSNHALQRTRLERRGCHRGVPRAGSLSLGRYAPLCTCPIHEASVAEAVGRTHPRHRAGAACGGSCPHGGRPHAALLPRPRQSDGLAGDSRKPRDAGTSAEGWEKVQCVMAQTMERRRVVGIPLSLFGDDSSPLHGQRVRPAQPLCDDGEVSAHGEGDGGGGLDDKRHVEQPLLNHAPPRCTRARRAASRRRHRRVLLRRADGTMENCRGCPV